MEVCHLQDCAMIYMDQKEAFFTCNIWASLYLSSSWFVCITCFLGHLQHQFDKCSTFSQQLQLFVLSISLGYTFTFTDSAIQLIYFREATMISHHYHFGLLPCDIITSLSSVVSHSHNFAYSAIASLHFLLQPCHMLHLGLFGVTSLHLCLQQHNKITAIWLETSLFVLANSFCTCQFYMPFQEAFFF